MAINKDDLKKLSPEERIKKLKEMEVERKKELEEAADLIKRTEAEIEEIKRIPNIEIPRIEEVDISKIFESPQGLEATVRKEAPLSEEEQNPIKYVQEQAEGPASMYVEQEGWHEERIVKVEDMIKYQSTQDHLDELTASRSTLKNIKKYTSG